MYSSSLPLPSSFHIYPTQELVFEGDSLHPGYVIDKGSLHYRPHTVVGPVERPYNDTVRQGPAKGSPGGPVYEEEIYNSERGPALLALWLSGKSKKSVLGVDRLHDSHSSDYH